MKKGLFKILYICFLTMFFSTLLPGTSLAQVKIIPDSENPRMAFLTEENALGYTVKGSFSIENPQESNINVELYALDGTHTQDGTFSIKPENSTQILMGKWLTMDQNNFAIDSQGKKTINFTIAAPTNTTSGIYHGAILAIAKQRIKRGETAPTFEHKTILPVFIKIPGESITAPEYKSFSYSVSDNQIYYNYQVSNNGNNIIVITPTLESKFLGIFTKQTSLAKKKLFPGDSINFFTNLRDRPWPGVYLASGIISFSEYDIFTDTETSLSTESKSFTIYHRIHNYLLIPAILLLILTLYLLKKIHYKRLYLKGSPYQPQLDDTIYTVAKKFHIKWKKLATINNLSAPYSISPSSTIIIPKRKFKKYTKKPATKQIISSPAKNITKISTVIFFLIFTTTFPNFASSQQTETAIEIKSGAIFIEPPKSINLNKWFIPTEDTGPFYEYKTLSPEIRQNQLIISDHDTGGINYKVSVSLSNLTHMDIPHSIIPFTNFGLVSLATDTRNNIDIVAGTTDLTGITLPAACSWNATAGTLKENCDILLTQRTFIGDGQTSPVDPTSPLSVATTTINVENSTQYKLSDILLINDEKILITEITSPSSLQVIRGISSTTPSEHQAQSSIKNFGTESLEQDLFIGSEDVHRASIFSMGFGIRTLLEPSLDLHPGNYGGTITFSLYTCVTDSCL